MTTATADRAELVEAMLGAPAWREDAACAGLDPEMADAIFFPTRGGSVDEAKAICAGCAVRVECLEYALATVIRTGVFGGLSERERRRERHLRRCTRATCPNRAHLEADPDPAPAWVAPQFRPLWRRHRAPRRATFGSGSVASKRIARALVRVAASDVA